MLIGGRTRGIHEAKKLWQGDIEKRSGLLARISPGLRMATPYRLFETLEKLARALEVSLYQLFYEGEEPPRLPHLPKRLTEDRTTWGSTGKQARVLSKFRGCSLACTRATVAFRRLRVPHRQFRVE